MNHRKSFGTIAVVAISFLSSINFDSKAQSLLYPQHFDLSEIRITGGHLREAMVTNARMLLDYDVDRIMTPFIREAKLDQSGKKYDGWIAKHPSFPNWGDYSWSLEGHIGGHYVSALALGYSAMRNDSELSSLAQQMYDRLQYCLVIMQDCQDAYKGNKEGMEGFIGGQPYSEMWTGMYNGDLNAFFKHSGKVPFYCQHKILAGLRDAYVYAGSKQALEMFRNLCDWHINVVAKFNDEQMQKILNTEHGGVNETLADAYHLFGDKKYLDAAVKFSHNRMIEGMATKEGHYNEHFLDRNHANTQVPKYVGFERIAQFNNTESKAAFSEAARNFWNDVATHRTVCIGGNSVGEHFLPSDNCKPYMTNLEGPESCNTNNMMKLTEELFDASHDSQYADFYESALWNHILSTQDPTTGGYVYFTTLRPGGYRIYSQVDEGMWCCVGTGMENHSKYAHFTYTHLDSSDKKAKDILYVNLFMPTELNNEKYGLKQETGFPYEQGSRITITKAGNYTLAIRKPSWVAKGFEVKVNGVTLAEEIENGYVLANRKWKAGDVVEVKLPMELRLEECPNYTDYVAFKVGPLLLAARTTAQNESEAHLTGLHYEKLQNEYADDSRMGHSPGARANKLPLNDAPMFIGERNKLLEKVQAKLPALHLYSIQPDVVGKTVWPKLTLEPFYKIHHSRYACYWYARTAEEYAQSPMVQADQAAAALDAKTIDFVATGEQQSEAGHLMVASAGCTKGGFNSEACREIPTSNEVSYTFTNMRENNEKPIPSENVAVMLRFVRNDAGRVCSIYIDDFPIAENFVTPREHPSLDENNFMNVVIPVPIGLLKDEKGNPKQSLKFTLKATDKGLAPSIFYLRLIDDN